MAVKTKDELLAFLKDKTKDDTSDETLGFIADITDTMNDYETKVHDQTDWKAKYEENDKEWREKYKERFFEGGGDTNTALPKTQSEEDDHKAPTRFEDLFTVKKG